MTHSATDANRPLRVDSHHHLWNYSAAEYSWISDEMTVLRRDFSGDDLQEVLARTGLNASVAVQARQSIEETDWLLQQAAATPTIRGVVGWAPLRDPDVLKSCEAWADARLLKGLRHVVQDEPDDEFLLGSEFHRGVECLSRFGWTYDILIYARQLPAAIRFVDLHPAQPFVLDHIAKPTIRASEFDQTWADNIRELARRPHVCCKFSGVATEVRDADWNLDVIRPYWDVALNAFGPERLMFGSDWPVCLLKTDYDRWVATVDDLLTELTEIEQQQIQGIAAQKFYNLRED